MTAGMLASGRQPMTRPVRATMRVHRAAVDRSARDRPTSTAAHHIGRDILVALHLRLHELARPVLERLAAETGPAGWAAVLCGLVDTMLANRKLFILHQRNQTALLGLHIKGHDGDHEEIEQQFRRILGNIAIPARDRVRLSCALGALLSSLMTASDLGDLSIETYGDLLREAITDLLEPRSDVSRAHRADER
jgi:hypothetical protein